MIKQEILDGFKGEVVSSKFIDSNTLRIKCQDGSEVIRFYNTDIITIRPNGNYIFTSGGWQTMTTKQRLNDYSPFHLYQKNHLWYICHSDTVNGYDYNWFYDGMEYKKMGNEYKLIRVRQSPKDLDKMKTKIKKYVNLLDDMDIPQPSSGDCWYCSMSTQDDKSLGDAIGNKEHLQSHMKEKYLHGSILINAMKDAGYQDDQIGFHYQLQLKDTFKKSLRKYLQKRLLSTV
jgi:hypothetical protein